MSYVGGDYTCDIFVSYSHGDDGLGGAYLLPWSVAFSRELEYELRADRKYRQDLRVFLDKDHRPEQGVDPMAPLTDLLRQKVGESALLVVLMSPDYLASQWCTEERDWWRAHQVKLGLPTEERIAVVRIWPTNQEWPSLLTDARGQPLVGFLFHTQFSNQPRPLGWTDLPGPFGREFRKALLDIIGWLSLKLDAMKARVDELQRQQDEAARLAQASGQAIYLHGRAEHAQVWEQAALALTDNGFAVVPGAPDAVERDPAKLQKVRDRRVEILTGCDALLLLGTGDGRALDADLVVVGRHDRQSARARSKRLLPCGLLDTVGGAIATPVRRATARNVQADWIDCTQPPWVPRVQRWLADKGARLEHSP